jgi:hypothetical protein
MSDSTPLVAHLIDLTEMTLDKIVHLCETTGRDLDPEDIADRPVLQRALRRVQAEADRGHETFCGHANNVS